MLPEEEIAEALAFQFQPLSGSWMARDVEYTFKSLDGNRVRISRQREGEDGETIEDSFVVEVNPV